MFIIFKCCFRVCPNYILIIDSHLSIFYTYKNESLFPLATASRETAEPISQIICSVFVKAGKVSYERQKTRIKKKEKLKRNKN